MKRLAAMQLWPAFWNRARAAVCAGDVDVGVGEHDERVGAAELEDGLLQRAPGRRRATALPARSLPVSVTAATRGSSIDRAVTSPTRVADQQRAEQTGREARVARTTPSIASAQPRDVRARA